MSIIQTIRDKAAPLVIILIGISLVGFIAMDAFVGKSSGMFGGETKAGSINGNSVDFKDLNASNEFNDVWATVLGGKPQDEDAKVGNNERQWQIATYYEAVKKEADKLGLTITESELNEGIKMQSAQLPFAQIFGDPSKAQSPEFMQRVNDFCKNRYKFLNAIIKEKENAYKQQGFKSNGSNDPEDLAALKKAFSPSLFEKANIEPMRKLLLIQKYMLIMGKASFVPTWMAEAVNAQGTQLVNMQYVYAPYSAISDSSLGKISNDEIEKYVASHKELYRQEPNKQVSYVTFNASASAKDSAALIQKMEAKRAEFAASTDAASFLAQAGSVDQYKKEFKSKTQWGFAKFDSMAAKGVGNIGGPFVENGAMVLTKILSTKVLADSAKARHILIGTVDPRTRQKTRSNEEAGKLADSVLKLVKAGGNFDTLVARFSEDDGSKAKGGLYESFAYGQMVPEFNDFCFEKPAGTTDTVKTSFGYHIIQNMGTKGSSTKYQMAVYSQTIRPSEITTNGALNEANKFSSANKTTKAFDEAAKNSDGKINKLIATVKAGENKVNQIPSSQSIIRDFLNKAKPGDVSNPIKVEEKYYVCNLVADNKEGTMSANGARQAVERILFDKKKAAQLMEKAKGASSLEDAAAKLTVTVIKADSIAYANGFIPNVGGEPKVVGAAFDKTNMGKLSAPIAGDAGLFFIQPSSFGTKMVAGSVADTRKGLENEGSQNGMQLLEVLKRKIKVDDNRNKFQ